MVARWPRCPRSGSSVSGCRPCSPSARRNWPARRWRSAMRDWPTCPRARSSKPCAHSRRRARATAPVSVPCSGRAASSQACAAPSPICSTSPPDSSARVRRCAATDDAAVEQSLLIRKRQLREADEEVARLLADVETRQEVAASLAADLGALRTRLGSVNQDVQLRQGERLGSEKDIEQVSREHDRVQRHLETLGSEIRQVESETQETTALLTHLEHHVEAAREVEVRQEAAMAAARLAIDTAQARETELVAELTACRVDLASVTERAEALTRELVRLDQMEADVTERVAQAQQRQAQLAERRQWLAEERERTDASARDVAVERDRLEGEARGAGERHQTLLDEVATIELEMRGVQAELSRATTAMH